MFEKLISTLMASRDQAHIFHWQTTGPGSFAAHLALATYYEAIPDMIDARVETYQGKYGIISGYTPAEQFADYNDLQVVNYFKALGAYVEKTRTNPEFPQDAYLQNIVDEMHVLIYSTLYKMENLG